MTTPHDAAPEPIQRADSITMPYDEAKRTSIRSALSGNGALSETEPVVPWSSIHVQKANEQLTSLTTKINAAIAAEDWQQVETLTRSQLHLATFVSLCYGR